MSPYVASMTRLGRRSAGWRAVVVDATGREIPFSGRTQQGTWDQVERGLVELGQTQDTPGLSVSAAALLFVAERRDRGFYGERSVVRAREDLWLFASAAPERPCHELQPAAMHALLERMTAQQIKLAGQRSRWHQVAIFLRWCVIRGQLERNPCERIDRIDLPWASRRGRSEIGRGKAQLANSERAAAYLEAAIRWPAPEERVAAALPLLTGMRSGELRNLRVASLDRELGVLWIRHDGDAWSPKTAASARAVQLPELLRDDLEALAAGRDDGDLLLRSSAHGGAFGAPWLWKLVRRTCDAASLPPVCPHGLRGTYASICAQHAQLPAPQIARLLGHSDHGITAQRHYVGAARPAPALRVVSGGRG